MLFFLFTTCLFVYVNAQNCANAPTASLQFICNQISSFNKNAQETIRETPSIAGPPPLAGPMAVAASNIYECFNITCICQFLGGSGGESCTLPNGQPYRKAVRQEIRSLTPDQWQRYVNAMWTLRNNGQYVSLSTIHSNFALSPGAHSGPAFLPWHREFLKRLEIMLRQVDPTVSIPYWDSRIENRIPNPLDSTFWSNNFMGAESSDGQVRSGRFANWPFIDNSRYFRRNRGAFGSLFTENDVAVVVAQTDYRQVLASTAPGASCPNPAQWSALEYSHGNPHVWIGGDMQVILTSTNDPLFFNHHSFVDYIWENYRTSRQTRAQRESQYPASNSNCFSSAHYGPNVMQPWSPIVNTDGLQNMYTDSLYSYAQRPYCTQQTPNGCNSPYLFCDLSHGTPACAAMIMIGGNCNGFVNGERPCYNGVCSNGRCVASVTQAPTTTPAPSPTCYNSEQCCQPRAAAGQCGSAYMNSYCRAACNLCNPTYNPSIECNNRFPQCAGWAQNGECTRNPDWMTENCRQACNRCGVTRAQACQSVAGTTTPAPSSCLNQHFCCVVWQNQNYCTNSLYRTYMQQNCAPSCGYCQGPPGLTSPSCLDFNSNCAYWRNQGYCSGTYANYMLENCRASCGRCDLSNYNNRAQACGFSSSSGSQISSLAAPMIASTSSGSQILPNQNINAPPSPRSMLREEVVIVPPAPPPTDLARRDDSSPDSTDDDKSQNSSSSDE